MDLRKNIRSIPNFPKDGILFRDITPLLANVEAYRFSLSEMSRYVKDRGAEAVVAIESRGFMFACPVAQMLGLPFIPVRKPGKLPAKTKSVEYQLEYGSGRLEMHEDSITAGTKVAVVDDLLATGGTARAAADLVRQCGGEICAYSFLIELSALKGRDLLNSEHIEALLVY